MLERPDAVREYHAGARSNTPRLWQVAQPTPIVGVSLQMKAACVNSRRKPIPHR
jgi:hypothetical protein